MINFNVLKLGQYRELRFWIGIMCKISSTLCRDKDINFRCDFSSVSTVLRKMVSFLKLKNIFFVHDCFLMSRCMGDFLRYQSKNYSNQPGSSVWMLNAGRPQTVGNWGLLMDTNSDNWHYFLFLPQRDCIPVRREDSILDKTFQKFRKDLLKRYWDLMLWVHLKFISTP